MLFDEDLQKMDCYGLMESLWCLQDDEMVGELTTFKSSK